jgi:VanZ family protein
MRHTMPKLYALLHETRFQPGWRLLLALLALVAAWFAFTPGPVPGPDFEDADKLNHLLAFGSMGSAGLLSLASGWRQALGTVAGLLTYGGFIELVQSRLPTRTASWADLLADACGILLGLVFASTLRRRWPPKD